MKLFFTLFTLSALVSASTYQCKLTVHDAHYMPVYMNAVYEGNPLNVSLNGYSVSMTTVQNNTVYISLEHDGSVSVGQFASFEPHPYVSLIKKETNQAASFGCDRL